MLRRTFIHLPGIGLAFERRLREQGIIDWQSLSSQEHVKGIGTKRLVLYKQLLRSSKEALLAGDASFFARTLPSAEHWRAYDEFKEESLYLDVEVDRYGEVSVVTMTDGIESKVLVKGVNLCKEELERALAGAKLLVTYNGASFDLPLLRKQFRISWEGLHVDLRTVAKRKGFFGGLKDLEKRFGLVRDYEEKLKVFIKGGDPSLLYRMWRGSGDRFYLDLLLEYNEADAQHLFLLAQKLLHGVRLP